MNNSFPDKEKNQNSIKKFSWFRKFYFELTALILILIVFWFILNWEEFYEAFEANTCNTACPSLTPEQLRLQVIKSYLHDQLKTNIENHDAGGNYQLVLLPFDMTAKDVEESIKKSTLLEILNNKKVLFDSDEKIDSLSVDSIKDNPSVAVYSLSHRVVQIIPLRSIRAANEAEVKEYAEKYNSYLNNFSFWEKNRGYGKHFFWINDYPGISLVCCDGLGNKQGDDLYSWNKDSFSNIKLSRPHLMAVSDRGKIFIRQFGDEKFILY